MRVELMGEDAPALDVERRREALRAGIEQSRQPAEGRKAKGAVDRKNLDPRHDASPSGKSALTESVKVTRIWRMAYPPAIAAATI